LGAAISRAALKYWVNLLQPEKEQEQIAAAAAVVGSSKRIKKEQQPPAHQQQNQAAAAAAAPPSAAPSTGITCEICDVARTDKNSYLLHLQSSHGLLKQKSAAYIQKRASIACSRCKDRFWTYEGLERHLVMSHGLVTSDLLMKAQTKKDGGRCKLCSKQVELNMLQHLVAGHQVRLASAEITYSCDNCSYTSQSYQKLKEHLSKRH
ncbi:hypothetical protein PENTCL1PPCAC_24199, partial [Pristionchus entomophagus]